MHDDADNCVGSTPNLQNGAANKPNFTFENNLFISMPWSPQVIQFFPKTIITKKSNVRYTLRFEGLKIFTSIYG